MSALEQVRRLVRRNYLQRTTEGQAWINTDDWDDELNCIPVSISPNAGEWSGKVFQFEIDLNSDGIVCSAKCVKIAACHPNISAGGHVCFEAIDHSNGSEARLEGYIHCLLYLFQYPEYSNRYWRYEVPADAASSTPPSTPPYRWESPTNSSPTPSISTLPSTPPRYWGTPPLERRYSSSSPRSPPFGSSPDCSYSPPPSPPLTRTLSKASIHTLESSDEPYEWCDCCHPNCVHIRALRERLRFSPPRDCSFLDPVGHPELRNDYGTDIDDGCRSSPPNRYHNSSHFLTDSGSSLFAPAPANTTHTKTEYLGNYWSSTLVNRSDRGVDPSQCATSRAAAASNTPVSRTSNSRGATRCGFEAIRNGRRHERSPLIQSNESTEACTCCIIL